MVPLTSKQTLKTLLRAIAMTETEQNVDLQGAFQHQLTCLWQTLT